MDSTSIHKNIRVVSDIHLEHYATPPNFEDIISPSICDILCLLGDIGNPHQASYESFIIWCRQNFATVLVIAGNHEYYNSTVDRTNKLIEKICKRNGAIFLNNSVFIHKNIAFIGTTLWSHVPEIAREEVGNYLTDYSLIRGFTVETSNQMHRECVEFLEKSVQKLKDEYKLIVLSHHSPSLSGTSYPPYEQRLTNFGFSSDQSELIQMVDMWMYGHTHYNHPGNVFEKYDTPLVCNQRGYVGNFSRNYNKDFVIEVNYD